MERSDGQALCTGSFLEMKGWGQLCPSAFIQKKQQSCVGDHRISHRQQKGEYFHKSCKYDRFWGWEGETDRDFSSYTYIFEVQLKTKETVCPFPSACTGVPEVCRVESGALLSLQGVTNVDCERRQRKLCFPRCCQSEFVPAIHLHHLGLFPPHCSQHGLLGE